jgi:hypothetical protein
MGEIFATGCLENIGDDLYPRRINYFTLQQVNIVIFTTFLGKIHEMSGIGSFVPDATRKRKLQQPFSDIPITSAYHNKRRTTWQLFLKRKLKSKKS